MDCSLSVIWVSAPRIASLGGADCEEEATEGVAEAGGTGSSGSWNLWSWALDFMIVCFPNAPSRISSGSLGGMFVTFFLRIFVISPPRAGPPDYPSASLSWLSRYACTCRMECVG
jgi:hypothetical protein